MVFSKLPPKSRLMPVQYGQCSNRAGCSLAYTGEIVRYEGEARCPECGQALIPAKRTRKKQPFLAAFAVLLLLTLGATAFLVWQRQAQPGGPPSPGGLLATPGPAENRGPAMVEGDTTKLPADLARSLVTDAAASPSPAASPGAGTPPKIVNEPAEGSDANTPPPASPSPAAAAASPPAPAPSFASGEESVVTQPPVLSSQQVDTTRADVLKRINAMPRMSQQEKDRLAQRVESAHGMERLRIVHFDRGKASLSKAAGDELTRSFDSGDAKTKLADPTLVLVVAGYADSGGDANANLRISQDRADGISKLLKKAGVLNVIHTVAMGSTDLLDSKRPDQNRAVEIWAVTP